MSIQDEEATSPLKKPNTTSKKSIGLSSSPTSRADLFTANKFMEEEERIPLVTKFPELDEDGEEYSEKIAENIL